MATIRSPAFLARVEDRMKEMSWSTRCERRASRARELARARPEAKEPLEFFAEVALFQAGISAGEPLASFRPLVDLVLARGPGTLATAARELDEESCRRDIESHREGTPFGSPSSFFARVLLQASLARRQGSSARRDECRCSRCGHSPQVGCLNRQGDGTALTLVCSLCLDEWSFPRGRCCGCGAEDAGALAFYETPGISHVRVQACDRCRRYLHLVRMDAEPNAVPEVEEISVLALDVWARGQGYQKLVPNLAGI
jgi:FdhE protein